MSSRPYRSKRHRPCDQCRERKLGCQTDGGIPCLRCKSAQMPCTFAHPPPKRPRLSSHPIDNGYHSIEETVGSSSSHPDLGLEYTAAPLEEPVTGPSNLSPAVSGHLAPLGRSPTQFVQLLDQLDGFSAQLFGASAESDPWLLRHCSFDDAGVKCFYKVHFRNAGGVPTAQKIPVHFMIAAEDLATSAKFETRIAGPDVNRDELNRLVPHEYGQRLVALFVKYVYPALPVISRSQMGITSMSQFPNPIALDSTPLHLLAAIYASALPFAGHDDYLSVLNTYNSPPVERLWRMVYELVAEEIHSPHLAVLQAGLLYLHRPLDDSRCATADSPFVWSLVGSLVGLACSLGLHIECRMWGIPAWEKRLRRRLWWAIYAEDKWRSLLQGRPPYIHQGEWDMSDLDAADFVYSRQGAAARKWRFRFGT